MADRPTTAEINTARDRVLVSIYTKIEKALSVTTEPSTIRGLAETYAIATGLYAAPKMPSK